MNVTNAEEATRICPDCGVDISDRHGNAKRCGACASNIEHSYRTELAERAKARRRAAKVSA